MVPAVTSSGDVLNMLVSYWWMPLRLGFIAFVDVTFPPGHLGQLDLLEVGHERWRSVGLLTVYGARITARDHS